MDDDMAKLIAAPRAALQTGPDMRMCWEVGDWMRAVWLSLPGEAHAEFGSS